VPINNPASFDTEFTPSTLRGPVSRFLEPLDRLTESSDASKAAGLSSKQRSRKYPTRLARYLIPQAWIEELRGRVGRPLRICEIGTGSGQMKTFVDFMGSSLPAASQPLYAEWEGLDIAPQTDKLTRAGYASVQQFDADKSLMRTFKGYDVILLLHVLEHLKDPEGFYPKMAAASDPGTLIIVGVPASAVFLARRREVQLRKKYLPGGHWCKFSPQRLDSLMAAANLENKELTGAFFLRASGLFLENYRWWFQLNLFLAAKFPGWPGEVYCKGIVPGQPAGQ
jgi:2-polyprenyl-3-methyl-5-hydroxy-6-metoxy-1,4-benzoquinol methylase